MNIQPISTQRGLSDNGFLLRTASSAASAILAAALLHMLLACGMCYTASGPLIDLNKEEGYRLQERVKESQA